MIKMRELTTAGWLWKYVIWSVLSTDYTRPQVDTSTWLKSGVAGTTWYKSDADGGIDRKLVDATKTALKLGYYHLDGAEFYNTEPELGLAIRESKVAREKLFVTTKVINNVKDIPYAIDASLKKLQLDYVDLSVAPSPWQTRNFEVSRDGVANIRLDT